MKFIELEQGSPAWHEFRRNGIGASDSAAILGISPWKTELELYSEKISGKQPNINPAMKRGSEREGEAREWINFQWDYDFKPCVVQHSIYPWKFASLDGYDEDTSVLLEIKWANAAVHEMAKNKKIPEYYYAQIQSQLSCTGAYKCLYLSCLEMFGIVYYEIVEVARDDAFIEKMIEKELVFITALREKNIELLSSYPRNFRTFDVLCERYVQLTEEIKDLEEQKERYREEIVKHCDGEDKQSVKFKLSKVETMGTVDYKSIPEIQALDLGPYRKEKKSYWKITRTPLD